MCCSCHRTFTYDVVYDLSKTYDIVLKITVLAILTYDIVRYIVYDIVRKTYDVVRKTYDVVYDVSKTYDIVVLGTVLAILTYDIVYDIVRLRTMSYTMLLQCRTSHRYYTM